jgi:hypothetical protein
VRRERDLTNVSLFFCFLAFAESKGRDSSTLDPFEKHLTHLLIESQLRKQPTHLVNKLDRALRAKGQARTADQQVQRAADDVMMMNHRVCCFSCLFVCLFSIPFSFFFSSSFLLLTPPCFSL